MKIKYLLFLSVLIVFSAKSQTKNINNGTALQYFIKEYQFDGDTNRRFVFIPLETENIPTFIYEIHGRRDLKYWSILQQYYPEFSIEDLKKMITGSPIINKNMIHGLPNAIILEQSWNMFSKIGFYELRKKFNYTSFCLISNIVYSKDKKTCILYVSIPQSGSFTVEIKMDDKGQWNSFVYTQETMA